MEQQAKLILSLTFLHQQVNQIFQRKIIRAFIPN